MHDLIDKIKRYGWFTPEELKAVIISILVMALIIGFDDGRESFNLLYWLHNFIGAILIVTISFLISQAGHRLLGLHLGFTVEYKIWWYGLTVGLIVMLVTMGKLWVLIPGGIWIHHHAIHRLGRFRYGPNVFAFGMISLMGPLFNFFFATLLKTIDVWFNVGILNIPFFNQLFLFNIAYAAYQMLPIPPLSGSRVFFHSRNVYVFLFGCVASYAVLYFSGVYSYILALIAGILIWIVYYVTFERGAWKPFG